ncbi:unnamed protein product [Auanema sp. JU1783]|nr:unnamed protein product [Auanema sp. JU1783]
MGNTLDRIGGYEEPPESTEGIFSNPLGSASKKKKLTRKRTSSQKSVVKPEHDEDEPEVKSFKLDTPHYLYEKLFLRGEDSNITVRALDRTWKLHRFYLQQCSFFEALLSGDWSDSKKEVHDLDIPDDPNITTEGLDAVFGSLYQNELLYREEDLISIAATASYFQLDSVLNRCDEEMEIHLNDNTIMRYLRVAAKYGLSRVEKTAQSLLHWNFWRLMTDKNMLKELEETYFMRLLSSTELLLVEGEMDLYAMLKTWIFLQHHPECSSLKSEAFIEKEKSFFTSQPRNSLFFKYSRLLGTLRLHHLVMTTSCLQELDRDGLIPREIINGIMVDQWKTLLENEEKPEGIGDIAIENFYINCIRLGRVVKSSPKCWRWSGYNSGMDVILNYNKGLLTMKRNCLSQATPYSISLKGERTVHFRMVVCNAHGTCLHDTAKQAVSLRLDQSVVICRLADTTALPITVHFFYLAAHSPPPSFLYINKFVNTMKELQGEDDEMYGIKSEGGKDYDEAEYGKESDSEGDDSNNQGYV